jgi:two-component system, cell cycle sensor histidine kinase and response regulator CckA
MGPSLSLPKSPIPAKRQPMTPSRAEPATRCERIQARLERVLTTIPDVVFSVSPDWSEWLYVSPGARTALGCEPDALDERLWWERVHPGDREKVATLGTQALARSGSTELDFRLLDDAGVRWLSGVVTPVHNPDGSTHLDGILRDVTAHRTAERAREQACAELEAILDTTPLAVIGLDLDARVTLWNATAEEIFGWRSEELVGRPYPLTAPDDEGGPHELFRAAFGGELVKGKEIRRHRRDGDVVELLLWNAPLLDPSGEMRGLVGVMADTSERRRLEAELRQAQKMEAVGRLAGGVAHDFNNLLTAIGLNAEFLLGGLAPDDPRRAEAQEIVDAVERGTTLTRQLLTFSRRQIRRPVVVRVNAVVRETEKLLRRLLGADISLTVDLDPLAGAVRADRGQLEQVLMNLAVNARDAMPDGGPLRLRTRPLSISDRGAEHGSPPGRYVELEVRDGGHGIPPEVMRHIFEPFFTTKEQGTGLGLATAYAIVQESGGRIYAESEVGGGTTFRVLLPAVDDLPKPGEPAGERDARTPALGEGETVLLVEDDPSVRHASARMLVQLGYRVLAAEDGASAMRLAAAHGEPIDLLLTDVVMPGMSGRELSGEIRRLHPRTRTLYTTGYTQDEVLRRGVEERRERLIMKPYSPANLAWEVRRAVEAVAASTVGRATCAGT